jgi:hypothetical protein
VAGLAVFEPGASIMDHGYSVRPITALCNGYFYSADKPLGLGTLVPRPAAASSKFSSVSGGWPTFALCWQMWGFEEFNEELNYIHPNPWVPQVRAPLLGANLGKLYFRHYAFRREA